MVFFGEATEQLRSHIFQSRSGASVRIAVRDAAAAAGQPMAAGEGKSLACRNAADMVQVLSAACACAKRALTAFQMGIALKSSLPLCGTGPRAHRSSTTRVAWWRHTDGAVFSQRMREQGEDLLPHTLLELFRWQPPLPYPCANTTASTNTPQLLLTSWQTVQQGSNWYCNMFLQAQEVKSRKKAVCSSGCPGSKSPNVHGAMWTARPVWEWQCCNAASCTADLQHCRALVLYCRTCT